MLRFIYSQRENGTWKQIRICQLFQRLPPKFVGSDTSNSAARHERCGEITPKTHDENQFRFGQRTTPNTADMVASSALGNSLYFFISREATTWGAARERRERASASFIW